MQVHYGYEGSELPGTVATVGIFDGVHLGHRALLKVVTGRAGAMKLQSLAVSFLQHPRHVLGEHEHQLLSTNDEKIRLLGECGLDHLVLLDFSHEFSRTKACDFIRDVLAGKLSARHLVTGYDHRLGRKGEGSFETINRCAEQISITAEQAGEFLHEGMPVSSSVIRKLLLKGDVGHASELLGYNYTLTGTVVEGKKIGRLIGFPTANIMPSSGEKLIPATGVYAVEVLRGSGRYKGMLSIGTNPTVNPSPLERSIEVHILGFDEDIYGRDITVIFRNRIRDEKKFSSTSELAARMEADKRETYRLLS